MKIQIILLEQVLKFTLLTLSYKYECIHHEYQYNNKI